MNPIRVVFDTNLHVAAARSRRGASFELLAQLPRGQFQIALSVALYIEWQAVMTRPEHMPHGVSEADTLGFLRYLASLAHLQEVHFLWRPFLRDPDDDMVLECAVASGARFIVTHNTKDFEKAASLNVQAMSPSDFLDLIRSTS